MKCEALNVILGEVRRMEESDTKYKSIIFERGPGRDIQITYTSARSSVLQPRTYHKDLWSMIDLVMPNISYLAYSLGYKNFAHLAHWGMTFTSWTLNTELLGDDLMNVLEAILHRVDEAMAVLDAPLYISLPVVQDLGVCPHCGAGMIMMDGSNDIYCPDGCTI